MPDQDAIVPDTDVSLLGDLDLVLGFLTQEKGDQSMNGSYPQLKQNEASASSANFGDLSDVMDFLNLERLRSVNSNTNLQERQQLTGNSTNPGPSDSPSGTTDPETSSAPKGEALSDDGSRAAGSSSIAEGSQSAPQTAPISDHSQTELAARKRVKSSSPKHQLSIDDPSSSSAGGASSESDSKTKLATPMEIYRPKRYWPSLAGKALRDMKRMAHAEQPKSLSSLDTTPTVRLTVKPSAFPKCEAFDMSRPRCNYDNFWNTGSESCAVVPVDTTHVEDATPSPQTKNLLAMRTRDSLLFPRGQTLLTKALNTPTFPAVSVVPTAPFQSVKDQQVFEAQSSERYSKPAELTRGVATTQTADALEPTKKVFIFVDNSNILFGYYQYYQKLTSTGKIDSRQVTSRQNQSKGLCRSRLPLFNYDAFFKFLQRQRDVERRVLVGSAPLYQDIEEAITHLYEPIILQRVRKFTHGELGPLSVATKVRHFSESSSMGNANPPGGLGVKDTESYTVPLISTPSTTREQGVDEMLHLKMMETIIDYPVPGIMVLASGDGGDSEFGGGGFCAVVKRALERGWQVEIVSWEDQLSSAYVDLAIEYGHDFSDDGRGHLRVLCLDWFAERFAVPASSSMPTVE